MPAGSQILRGLLINLKPDELFYSFTQAVDVLEKKDPKSIFYGRLARHVGCRLIGIVRRGACTAAMSVGRWCLAVR
jgi:hypothetical protein